MTTARRGVKLSELLFGALLAAGGCGTCAVLVNSAQSFNPPPPPPRLAPRYRVTDLGLYGSSFGLSALTGRGEVVGKARRETAAYENGNTESNVALWRNGRLQGLRPLTADTSRVHGVNEHVDVAGEHEAGQERLRSGTFPLQHAFLYRRGQIIDLGTLGGKESAAYALNDQAQVVGSAETGVKTAEKDARGEVIPGWLHPVRHAFLWHEGRMADLGTLGGYDDSEARDINVLGQIVGSASARAFLWENGKMKDLGLGYSDAAAINNCGQVVGTQRQERGYRAFLWEHGRVQDLGLPVGYDPHLIGAVKPVDINNTGQIVGELVLFGPTDFWHRGKRPSHAAFVWQDGRLVDLNSVVPASAGWTIDDVLAINDRGQVLTSGHAKGQYRGSYALLLTPK